MRSTYLLTILLPMLPCIAFTQAKAAHDMKITGVSAIGGLHSTVDGYRRGPSSVGRFLANKPALSPAVYDTASLAVTLIAGASEPWGSKLFGGRGVVWGFLGAAATGVIWGSCVTEH